MWRKGDSSENSQESGLADWVESRERAPRQERHPVSVSFLQDGHSLRGTVSCTRACIFVHSHATVPIVTEAGSTAPLQTWPLLLLWSKAWMLSGLWLLGHSRGISMCSRQRPKHRPRGGEVIFSRTDGCWRVIHLFPITPGQADKILD